VPKRRDKESTSRAIAKSPGKKDTERLGTGNDRTGKGEWKAGQKKNSPVAARGRVRKEDSANVKTFEPT